MARGTGLKRRSLFADEEEESPRQQRRKFVACVETLHSDHSRPPREILLTDKYTDASDATPIRSNVPAISPAANVAQWVARTNAPTLLEIVKSKSARSMSDLPLPGPNLRPLGDVL
jgi:hypothetical protein